jgi:hypothetical protein
MQENFDIFELLPVLLLGVIGGLLGSSFTYLNEALAAWRKKGGLPHWAGFVGHVPHMLPHRQRHCLCSHWAVGSVCWQRFSWWHHVGLSCGLRMSTRQPFAHVLAVLLLQCCCRAVLGAASWRGWWQLC